MSTHTPIPVRPDPGTAVLVIDPHVDRTVWPDQPNVTRATVIAVDPGSIDVAIAAQWSNDLDSEPDQFRRGEIVTVYDAEQSAGRTRVRVLG